MHVRYVTLFFCVPLGSWDPVHAHLAALFVVPAARLPRLRRFEGSGELRSQGAVVHSPHSSLVQLLSLCSYFHPGVIDPSHRAPLPLPAGKVPAGARGTMWASFDGKDRVQLGPGDAVVIRMSRWPLPVRAVEDVSYIRSALFPLRRGHLSLFDRCKSPTFPAFRPFICQAVCESDATSDWLRGAREGLNWNLRKVQGGGEAEADKIRIM